MRARAAVKACQSNPWRRIMESSALVSRAFSRILVALCLGFAITSLCSTPSFAGKPGAVARQDLTYAGRCGLFQLSPNNQRVWYRYDLRRWTYGDERDFSCFILEDD
jgi:hypothetical protein